MPKNNCQSPILPGQTIGILGGGQLGRMMTLAAKYMGYRVVVLDPTPNCPTAQVADDQIVASYDDLDAMKDLLNKADVITYEFENVDLTVAKAIEDAGKLPQGAAPLKVTQHRQREKEMMQKIGLPVSPFAIVENEADCEKAFEEIPFPVVMKTCQGGYDGKGQLKLSSKKDLSLAKDFVKGHSPCIIEQWISFDREISVVFTRSKKGEMTFFPISENIHHDQILAQSIVPAEVKENVKAKALHAARKVAEHMAIVGTFAVEMFVKGDDIFINEMAPRPHNSGHYTIEACTVDQFSQHIRAICGLPLANVRLLEPAVMVNLLGENLAPLFRILSSLEHGHIHLYGKEEAKEKRKMGHITFIAETKEILNTYVQSFKERMQQ